MPLRRRHSPENPAACTVTLYTEGDVSAFQQCQANNDSILLNNLGQSVSKLKCKSSQPPPPPKKKRQAGLFTQVNNRYLPEHQAMATPENTPNHSRHTTQISLSAIPHASPSPETSEGAPPRRSVAGNCQDTTHRGELLSQSLDSSSSAVSPAQDMQPT